MATFDMTYGNVAGLQMQGRPHVGVNFFELDFAEAKLRNPALVATDILTIGKLRKGMLVFPLAVETLEASQAGATDLVIQDDTGTPVVMATGHGIDTLGEITGPSVAASAFFGQTTSRAVLITADTKVNVLTGATLPTKGKLRVAFLIAQLGNV